MSNTKLMIVFMTLSFNRASTGSSKATFTLKTKKNEW